MEYLFLRLKQASKFYFSWLLLCSFLSLKTIENANNPVMSLCESRKYSMILLIFINHLAFVTAQDNPYGCISNGNYTSNSTYRANLNTLLASLSSNISDYGFYSSSVGQYHDTVNGLALCRGDQIVDQCRACVQSAAREILQSCPNQKQAVIWYEYCMLRYSNDPIYDTKIRDRTIPQHMLFNVSNGDQFRDDRARLLRDLQTRAVNGSSALKIGAGNRYTSSDPEAEAIYALVQCIPDLSLEDCGRCLTEATENMQNYISTWMRVLMPNCNIHYELTSFYNETRLRELGVLLQLAAPPFPIPSPPPSPLPLPPGTNAGNTRRKKHDNRTKVVIILVVSIGATLIFFACAVIFLIKGMKHRSHEITESIDGIRTAESLLYDFGKIRAATNDFNDANKLGQGGFGAVYWGKLPSGVEIAVKRLSKDSGQGRVEFKNEVLLVAKLQHKNLVRLLGFSTERTERVLVYEFVQNGSLDQFIFDPIKRSHLNWDRRYKIIEGIVRGLLYLHEDSRVRIIHRDLKASNILLDGDMNPKIADFGMARLFRRDETHGNTSKIAGTYGYMSPEYALHGEFSIKSDVFSFGVLLLEIISGESINCIGRGESDDHLLTLTWRSWREGTAANMIDPDLLRNDAGSLCKMLRCIHIGLLCVQENAADRPTMTSIVVMLRRSTTTLPEPSEPAFYIGSSYHPEVSILHKDYSEGDIVEGPSQNEMSLTELYPR